MRRMLFVFTVVMVLGTSTAALAQERPDRASDRPDTDCAVTDVRAATDCGTNDRPSDRVSDRLRPPT